MILLGLGSNIGEREKNIIHAIKKLQEYHALKVVAISSLYETEPVGFKEQPAFLNAVVSVSTSLDPFQLLEVCLAVEQNMGRIRDKRWGPRIVDIDLLLYHAVCLTDETLILPHPRLKERRFVLVPLYEITKDKPILQGLTAKDLLQTTEDRSKVVLFRQFDLKTLYDR